MNSASWTNQGPQQWDQSGSVDNQSGQFPHSAMPQDQYSQMDQQGQLQHGTVLYAMVVLYRYAVVVLLGRGYSKTLSHGILSYFGRIQNCI